MPASAAVTNRDFNKLADGYAGGIAGLIPGQEVGRVADYRRKLDPKCGSYSVGSYCGAVAARPPCSILLTASLLDVSFYRTFAVFQ